jgi:hypothetical protein
MKITKSQLKRIIKEEYQRVLEQPRFKTGVPEEDVLAHGLDLEKYPTTPEELESDRIAQELEDAWVAAGNPEKYLGRVDGDILDMAMAIRNGEMEMEDALAQVERMSMNEEKDWMQKAFSKNKGGLHKALGVPEGEDISVTKMSTALRAGGKKEKMARAAVNANPDKYGSIKDIGVEKKK